MQAGANTPAMARKPRGTIAFHLTSKWRHVKLCSGPGMRAFNL
jgi:hypothetical protein